MLSELCVRRPVFATMLVMSLVVLGLFSFRDLGVDLFPKADPAQVNVSLRLPGASPDEMTSSVIMPMENALSGIAGIDQMTANVNTGGTANISHPVRPRARPRGRGQRRPRKGRRRDAGGSTRDAAPGRSEAGSRRRSDHEHHDLEHEREPPHAHRDRRQAGEARARIGGRRRRRHDERRSLSRNPHRRRRREAECARTVDRPGGECHSTRERRDPRRHARAGQMGGRPAHAGPRRGHRSVQRRHRRHGERRPAPRVRYRICRGLGQEGGDLAVHGRRAPGRATRHPPRIRREHDQGDRRRQAEARHRS